VDRHGICQCLGAVEVEARENPSGLAAPNLGLHQEAGYTSAVVTVAPDPISVLQSGGVHRDAGARRVLMPTPDQFWQYAREAVLSASEAKNDDDRQRLLDLTRTWTQAALVARRSQIGNDKAACAV